MSSYGSLQLSRDSSTFLISNAKIKHFYEGTQILFFGETKQKYSRTEFPTCPSLHKCNPSLSGFYLICNWHFIHKWFIFSGASKLIELLILICPFSCSLSPSLWHFSSRGGWEAVRLQVWGRTPHRCSWVGRVQCLLLCVVMHMWVCYRVQLMTCDMQCVGDGTSREFETHIAKKTNHTNPHVNTHSCMTR